MCHIQCGWEALLLVCQDQPFKALHHDGRECYWLVVIQTCQGGMFGTGTMEVDLRHVGTAAWVRDMLKMSVKTPVSWSAHGTRHRWPCLTCADLAQCMVDIWKYAYSLEHDIPIKCPTMLQWFLKVILL